MGYYNVGFSKDSSDYEKYSSSTSSVEFSEDLSVKYTGAKALYQSVLYTLMIEKGVIPFNSYGIDYGIFTFNKQAFQLSVKKALSKYGSSVTVKDGRVTIADVSVPVISLSSLSNLSKLGAVVQ